MPEAGVLQLYGDKRMQELVLIRPGRKVDTELVIEMDMAALRRELEERLAECGTLAFRVARSVLRNPSDAEDVAQDAMLKAYRRFEGLRDRSRFRAWLVRITRSIEGCEDGRTPHLENREMRARQGAYFLLHLECRQMWATRPMSNPVTSEGMSCFPSGRNP